jgi:rubrerythrin
MRRSGVRPTCGSKDLLASARVLDRAEENRKRDLEVAAYDDPDALLFKGERRGKLAAWICTGCGYTELYCPDLF